MRQTIIFLIASCLIAVLSHAAFAQTTSNISDIDFADECELGGKNDFSTARPRVVLAKGHCRGWVLSIISIDDGDYESPIWLEQMNISKYRAFRDIQNACQNYKSGDYSTRHPLFVFQNGVCRSAVKVYNDYAGCWLWVSFEEVSTNLAAGRFSDPCQ